MRDQRINKKNTNQKSRFYNDDLLASAKPHNNNKVKYNHKNFWLNEDMDDIIPLKIKKKKITKGA